MRDEINNYEDTDDFKFTKHLYEKTDKGALVALYYALLCEVAEVEETSIFEIHNDLVDDIEGASSRVMGVH